MLSTLPLPYLSYAPANTESLTFSGLCELTNPIAPLPTETP